MYVHKYASMTPYWQFRVYQNIKSLLVKNVYKSFIWLWNTNYYHTRYVLILLSRKPEISLSYGYV